jgi:hypothetical protein
MRRPSQLASQLRQSSAAEARAPDDGHQKPSEAIRGHQWSSVAISGHQWPSVAISRNQAQSRLSHLMRDAISRNQAQSRVSHLMRDAISGNQSQSGSISHLMRDAISRNQAQSRLNQGSRTMAGWSSRVYASATAASRREARSPRRPSVGGERSPRRSGRAATSRQRRA